MSIKFDIKEKDLKEEMMIEFEIVPAKEEWQKLIKTARDGLAKNIEIKGFRKGQAPKELVDARITDEMLYKSAISSIGPVMIEEAMKSSDKIIKSNPQIKINKISREELSYGVRFFKIPEIKLPDWKTLDLIKLDMEVSKDELELEINNLLNRYSKLEVKNDGAAKGDVVMMNFQGFLDGEAFDGGKADNHALELGSNAFVPGFEDGLVGIKAGEKRDVKVKFPKDYPSKKLADKDTVFKCECISVNTKLQPARDDKFVEGLQTGFLKTWADLENNIKAHMKNNKALQERRANEDQIVKLIIDKGEVKMPKIWIENETNRLVQEFEQKIAMQGMTIEDYAEKTGNDEKKIKSELAKDAVSRLTTQFILDKVKIDNKLMVSQQQAKQEIEAAAKQMNRNPEDVEKEVGGIDRFRANLETKAAFDIIISQLNKKAK